jgi:hypothetical protein
MLKLIRKKDEDRAETEIKIIKIPSEARQRQSGD